MEKIGIIIEARMGSARLPGKVMKKINGKPMLYYLIKRLQKIKKCPKIIVATSKKKENDLICNFLEQQKILYYRGSETNVLLRVLNAAEKFHINTIISVTADCPLICPKIISRIIKKFKTLNVDYISTHGFLGGMDTQIYKKKSLKLSYKLNKSKLNKEHVTFFIRKSNFFKKENLLPNKKQQLDFNMDLVVDEAKDLNFIKKIFSNFKKDIFFSYDNLISFLKKNKKLLLINKDVIRKGDT